MRRTLLTIAAVLAAVLAAAGAFAVAGMAFGHTEQRSHTIHGTVTRVVVEGASGDVSLLGASVGHATVHERRHFAWRRPQLRMSLDHGVLRVAIRCHPWSAGCGDDLDIVVPRTVQSAGVRTVSGDISLAGLADGHFTATTESGDLRARRITGSVALRSESGDIDGSSLPDRDVIATSGSGDVAIR
jgi:putative adhesin